MLLAYFMSPFADKSWNCKKVEQWGSGSCPIKSSSCTISCTGSATSGMLQECFGSVQNFWSIKVTSLGKAQNSVIFLYHLATPYCNINHWLLPYICLLQVLFLEWSLHFLGLSWLKFINDDEYSAWISIHSFILWLPPIKYISFWVAWLLCELIQELNLTKIRESENSWSSPAEVIIFLFGF